MGQVAQLEGVGISMNFGGGTMILAIQMIFTIWNNAKKNAIG